MTVHLHPKYGFNPTISTCIICGKEKNEILLLGSAYMEIDSSSVVVRFDKEYEWMHGLRFGKKHRGHCWWISKKELKLIKE